MRRGELGLMVPFAHGRWLLRTIPRAQGRMVPRHGHISLVARYRDEVLEDLQRSASSGTLTPNPSLREGLIDVLPCQSPWL